MAWDKDAPDLVARAYHRVKCVRACSMMRTIAPVFALRHVRPRENLHQSFAGANACRSSEQVFARLIAGRSFRIHLAERWLMAT
jgi:hypothetical protein